LVGIGSQATFLKKEPPEKKTRKERKCEETEQYWTGFAYPLEKAFSGKGNGDVIKRGNLNDC